jgi:hypothetical protein
MSDELEGKFDPEQMKGQMNVDDLLIGAGQKPVDKKHARRPLTPREVVALKLREKEQTDGNVDEPRGTE